MNDYSTTTASAPEQKRGLRFKHILLIVLLSFVGGAIALGWLAKSYGYLDTEGKVGEIAPAPVAVAPAAANTALTEQPMTPPVASRVDELEDRLSQINQDAAVSAGNAARAEALLTAFAARRALDGGQSLGYIADQLQQRFGASQPQAVATILTVAQSPLTIERLTAELTALGPMLTTGQREENLWTTLKRETSELFVLRRDGTPSQTPSQRYQRALAMTEAGNLAGAMAEVRALPGAAAADGWLAKARQYTDARKALDTIERSSLVSGGVTAPAPSVQQAP